MDLMKALSGMYEKSSANNKVLLMKKLFNPKMVVLEKYMFVSHTKNTQWKINGSTSFAIDNMH